jgi:hypothetical protein
MDTLICAGGSGARVLEAIIHLCAAGLGPKKLRMFLIDPDGANGSVDKTKQLVHIYQQCRAAFGDGPFFTTELDLLQSNQGLRVWSPVDQSQTFDKVLNYDGLTNEQKDIVHLFFTEKELEMKMEVGFRGHPALGAAALSLLPLYQDDPRDNLWQLFRSSLRQDVTQGESRVVVAGSVFGGTGAATIHPLVRYLRSEQVLEANRDRLRVGAVALAPYFKYSAADAQARGEKVDASAAAKSERFPLASRSAAEYYEHLKKTNDWDFDAMYWVGDDSPMKVDYYIGGKQQTNPAHFVDLLGALACLDFFTSPPKTKACWYAGPKEDMSVKDENLLTWDDIPLRELDRGKLRKGLLAFHLVAAAHLGFFGPLVADRRLEESPHCVPWYLDRFVNSASSLATERSKASLKALTDYFAGHYLPWWDQIHAIEHDRVRLLNRAAWAGSNGETMTFQLSRLGSLGYPEPGRPSVDNMGSMDNLFTRTMDSARTVGDAGEPASKYLRILAHSAEGFVSDQSSAKATA